MIILYFLSVPDPGQKDAKVELLLSLVSNLTTSTQTLSDQILSTQNSSLV